MSFKPLIAAAIPAFNEEKTIAKVILLAQKYVDKVIVCDDGSSDFTTEIAKGLGADVVKHERRMGYGIAIQTLFRRVSELDVDVMVTLDADGQHDPTEIPRIIGPILEGKADVVIGSRFLEESENDIPTYRRLGVKAITSLTSKASGNNFSDAQCGFRAYNRRAIKNLRLNEGGMGVSAEILMKINGLGLRVVEVPATCRYHGLETSTQSPLGHGVSVIMSIVRLIVEERPLVFLGIPGALSIFVGGLFGIWMLRIYAIEHRIITNIALASMTFIFIGFFALSTAITLYAILRIFKTNH